MKRCFRWYVSKCHGSMNERRYSRCMFVCVFSVFDICLFPDSQQYLDRRSLHAVAQGE